MQNIFLHILLGGGGVRFELGFARWRRQSRIPRKERTRKDEQAGIRGSHLLKKSEEGASGWVVP
jgi:hypothetical protein